MPSFDGENLIITLDPTVGGVLTVDVLADLYEPWKDWARSSWRNRKFPKAFTPDGGNDVTDVLKQGQYSFLNNAEGWRVKPHESDGTYYFTGNLVVNDTSLPALIPTVGAYTTAIFGLQPITQVATIATGSGLDAGQDAKLTRIFELLDVVEGTLDAKEVLRVLLAAMAGKVNGADTSSITFRDQADTKDRITATVDGNGNRTAVAVDVS